MTGKKTTPTGAPAAEPIEYEDGQVVERTDGYYWVPADGGRDRGPYRSIEDAVPGVEESDDELDSDDVREAEEVLGIPDWVDPDTGELADDEHTRIEDH